MNCAHGKVLGGTVLAPALVCHVARYAFTEMQAEFLGIGFMDSAARNGACPYLEARPSYPDSYRSHDLGEPE
jgi:hypothetical protein